MRSKDVVIGMKVKVHDITWPESSCTFLQLYGANPSAERLTYFVKRYSSEDRCWILKKDDYGSLYVMAKDFEPYIEEGE